MTYHCQMDTIIMQLRKQTIMFCLSIIVPGNALKLNIFIVIQTIESGDGNMDKVNRRTMFGYSDFFQFSDGLAAVRSGNKYGFFDPNGAQVVPFKYDAVLNKGVFSESCLAVCEDGKYGFIDNKGSVVIPMEYEYYIGRYICEFNDGVAPVGKDGRIIFIDKGNNELFPISNNYFFVSGFCDGFAYVTEKCDNNKALSGLINKKGQLITPVEYNIIGLYNEGLIAVKRGRRAQYINKFGETVIDTEYEYLGDFVNHMAVVMTSERKFGMIDIDGNIIIEPKFDTLSNVIVNDITSFREGSSFGFLKTNGLVVAEYAHCTDVQMKEKYVYSIVYNYGRAQAEVDIKRL